MGRVTNHGSETWHNDYMYNSVLNIFPELKDHLEKRVKNENYWDLTKYVQNMVENLSWTITAFY